MFPIQNSVLFPLIKTIFQIYQWYLYRSRALTQKQVKSEMALLLKMFYWGQSMCLSQGCPDPGFAIPDPISLGPADPPIRSTGCSDPDFPRPNPIKSDSLRTRSLFLGTLFSIFCKIYFTPYFPRSWPPPKISELSLNLKKGKHLARGEVRGRL